MSAFLAPVFGAGYQSFTDQGVVNAGGSILTYLAGTTTPLQTWTDPTQAVSNGSTVVLNAAGRPANEIWLQSGMAYKFQVLDANGANVGPTYDNISGINDNAPVTGFIPFGSAPTYISATSFSLPGNFSSLFTHGVRVQYTLGGGVFTANVLSSSVAAGITTVNILPDTTNLDATLSAISVGAVTPGVETGTFAPSLTFNGGNTGITYNSRSGYYTRIAGWLFISVNIVLTSKGSSSGVAQIIGLPYASTTSEFIISGAYSGLSSVADLLGIIPASAAFIIPSQSGATAVTSLTDTNFTNTTNLSLSGAYRAF